MNAVKSPDARRVRVKVEAVCHDCRHRHRIDVEPDHFGRAAFDWFHKHRGHDFEFLSPSRAIPRGFDDGCYEALGRAPWWLDYRHNADIKLAPAADAQLTITLASLGTSSSFLSGREATAVDNGTNKYLDYEVTGKVTTGTSPTVDTEIRVYYVKAINDTPTWPDVFDGTDSAETVTNTQILDKLVLGWSGAVSATSNVTYPITSALTVAQAWGVVPDDFTFFLAHSTGVALNATAGNHELTVRGFFATST